MEASGTTQALQSRAGTAVPIRVRMTKMADRTDRCSKMPCRTPCLRRATTQATLAFEPMAPRRLMARPPIPAKADAEPPCRSRIAALAGKPAMRAREALPVMGARATTRATQIAKIATPLRRRTPMGASASGRAVAEQAVRLPTRPASDRATTTAPTPARTTKTRPPKPASRSRATRGHALRARACRAGAPASADRPRSRSAGRRTAVATAGSIPGPTRARSRVAAGRDAARRVAPERIRPGTELGWRNTCRTNGQGTSRRFAPSALRGQLRRMPQTPRSARPAMQAQPRLRRPWIRALLLANRAFHRAIGDGGPDLRRALEASARARSSALQHRRRTLRPI